MGAQFKSDRCVSATAPSAGADANTMEDLKRRQEYVKALIAEISILVRAIASDSTKRLTDIRIKWGRNKESVDLEYHDIVMAMSQVDNHDNAALVEQIGLLQAVKDELVSKTAPATGLSIAYTALVARDQRGASATSMNSLARSAYGDLASTARNHRWFIASLTFVALLLAIVAAWEGTKASIGRTLLQALEPLRTQQTTIAQDKFKLETASDKEILDGTTLVGPMLPICLRYLILQEGLENKAQLLLKEHHVNVAQTPQIREVCGRDEIVRHNFELAHDNLRVFLHFWPDLAGEPFSWVRQLVPASMVSVPAEEAACKPDLDGKPPTVTCGDVEVLAAPSIQTVANYTLPFIFGIIGSLLYVLVHHYSSMRANVLLPRDASLAYLRVILGIVVAACVSLLISAYSGPPVAAASASGSTAPSSLVGTLTLSASGFTFLAGFGAEAVFTLLEGLVARVFSATK